MPASLPGRLHDLGVLYLCPQRSDANSVCVCVMCVMCVQMQVSPMAMERQAQLQQQHNMHRLQTSFQVKKTKLTTTTHTLLPLVLTVSVLMTWPPPPSSPYSSPPCLTSRPGHSPVFGQHTHTHRHHGSIHSCGLGCVFGGCLPWAIWGWVWVRARWGGGMSGGLACEKVSKWKVSIIILTQISVFKKKNFFYQSLDSGPMFVWKLFIGQLVGPSLFPPLCLCPCLSLCLYIVTHWQIPNTEQGNKSCCTMLCAI